MSACYWAYKWAYDEELNYNPAGGVWRTDCGGAFDAADIDPSADLHVNYCPKCGGWIEDISIAEDK